eukprot:jgi/Psemu1/230656/e_gw1.3328.2.1
MSSSSSSSRSFPTLPSPLVVRKFWNSSVIGATLRSIQSSSRHSQGRGPSQPRVISCSFEVQVPTDTLRIHITTFLSTGSGSSSGTNQTIDNPSLSYKITFCTPRNSNSNSSYQPQTRRNRNPDGSITTTTTTSTLRWASKFTLMKGCEERDPFYEWTGMFVLGNNNKKPIALPECSFHHIEGIINPRSSLRNTEASEEPLSQQCTDASKRPPAQDEDAYDRSRTKRRRVHVVPADTTDEH